MFELLPVTSDYVATVFSVRKGSSTNHYWEQLTLVSVKWPWDEPVHLKFHDNWPVWESSKWIFLASPLEVFVGSHQPSGQRFGIHHDSPNPNRPQKISSSPFTRKSRFNFLQATIERLQDLVPSSLNSKMAWNNPKIEKCEQRNILRVAAILCYIYRLWSIGFSDDFLHVPYHPYLFFLTPQNTELFLWLIFQTTWSHQPRARTAPRPAAVGLKNTGRLASPWNPIGVQQRQQWINRSPQDSRPC